MTWFYCPSAPLLPGRKKDQILPRIDSNINIEKEKEHILPDLKIVKQEADLKSDADIKLDHSVKCSSPSSPPQMVPEWKPNITLASLRSHIISVQSVSSSRSG